MEYRRGSMNFNDARMPRLTRLRKSKTNTKYTEIRKQLQSCCNTIHCNTPRHLHDQVAVKEIVKTRLDLCLDFRSSRPVSFLRKYNGLSTYPHRPRRIEKECVRLPAFAN